MEPARDPITSTEITTSAPTAEPTAWQAWVGYSELLLGLWLMLSAFLWGHPPPTRANTWVFGLIIVVSSLSTMRTTPSRWIDRTAAVLLFITTLPLARYSTATAVNNTLVAIAIMLVSFKQSAGYGLRARV
jgi:hypothetical protein